MSIELYKALNNKHLIVHPVRDLLQEVQQASPVLISILLDQTTVQELQEALAESIVWSLKPLDHLRLAIKRFQVVFEVPYVTVLLVMLIRATVVTSKQSVSIHSMGIRNIPTHICSQSCFFLTFFVI